MAASARQLLSGLYGDDWSCVIAVCCAEFLELRPKLWSAVCANVCGPAVVVEPLLQMGDYRSRVCFSQSCSPAKARESVYQSEPLFASCGEEIASCV